jgi:phosphoenolpyruvate carboxykinase (ATP)
MVKCHAKWPEIYTTYLCGLTLAYMSVPIISFPSGKPVGLGLHFTNGIHYQSSPRELVEARVRMGEGELNDKGALVIKTGEFTGRSPRDKFIVYDEITAEAIDWNDFNQRIDTAYYSIIHKKIMAYLNNVPDIWIRDCYACADERYRMNIRVVTEKPWISLFAHNMFIRPNEKELEDFKAEWHVIATPGLKLDAKECGTRQHNAVVVSFLHKTILIAGTSYTGEIKKSIFGVLNFTLPHKKNVLSMHCSANVGNDGDTAIFFGLSGTGKTTLSADASRQLIGDDEHGWTEDTIFNFEGGCYAKAIHLSEEKEPEIFNAVKPGSLVENVLFFPGTNKINYDDSSITENTRVSYPLHYIANAKKPSVGGIPKNIFFLTCDAYGVLPPISRLTPEQAMYQFISGYTAKVAGTETGITEPKPTFSACFGAPFLPLHPSMYAQMLGEKIKKHNVPVWLVNTGWTGGEYGNGSRIKLSYTRAMIAAALEGKLTNINMETEPVFGLSIPLECLGVPKNILNPQKVWQSQDAFDEKRKFLAQLFIKNFERYILEVPAEIKKAGPKI